MVRRSEVPTGRRAAGRAIRPRPNSEAMKLTTRSTLRDLLARPGPLLVAGVTNALVARVATELGYEAVYVTGAGVANEEYGLPDVGLVTMSEVVAKIRNISAAIEVPILADADTGYGNAVNVLRTVREFERGGAAAIQLEDQVIPKKCGHFSGKTLCATSEMVGKISAAIEARRSSDLVIIARTDALSVLGFEEAVARANAYAEAGADIVFVESPESREQLRLLPKLVRAPLLANMVEGGRTPLLSADELGEMGYKVVLFANTALRAGIRAVRETLEVLKRSGSSLPVMERLLPWEERQRLVGLGEYQAWERRFVTGESADGGGAG